MGRVFDPENGLFRTIGQMTDVFLLSGAWVVCSLPLVTIGPATAALYYGVVKCVRRREPRVLANFWSAFKGNLKTGSLLTLIVGPLAALLMGGRQLLGLMAAQGDAVAQVMWVAYTLAMVIPLGVCAWVFPLISRFDSGLAGALNTAFRLCLGRLPVTVWSVAAGVVCCWLTVRFWFLPLWLVCPGLWALLSSFGMERVFRRSIPDPGAEDEDKPWYLR